jgi:ribosomal protein S28E/S33
VQKTVRGVLIGRVIELDEDLGALNGQIVEVQVTFLNGNEEKPAEAMSDGLAKVYEILGRSHHSGNWNDAERHNEHQP